MSQVLIRTGILCALAVASSSLKAALVVDGSIFQVLNSSGTRIGSTVDHWYFKVNSPGVVTIDVLSWEIDYQDWDSDSNVLEVFDVNGDGEIAFFDSVIWLFNDDGVLDSGDAITFNDDSSSTFGDGSIITYDSYLSLNLAAGNYVLAIGAFSLDVSEAVAGFNNSTSFPWTADGVSNPTQNIDHGDYRITWTGDLTITGSPYASIPESSSLLCCGIVALGLLVRTCSRKRLAIGLPFGSDR
ncbi:MAG: DVUA0089 family protein [Pirellulales bacterium]|nr:DVUA0089 family protein [Pirellulales bacterium]